MQRRGLSTTQLLNAMTTDYTIPSRPSTSIQEELIPQQSLTPLRKKQDQNQALHRYTNEPKAANAKHHFYSCTPGAVAAKANAQPQVLPLHHMSSTIAKNAETPSTPIEPKDAHSQKYKWDTTQERSDAKHQVNNPSSSASSSKAPRTPTAADY